MTKEELEEEAIQYAVDYPTSYGKGYKHKDLREAYLAGAEPREKRIEKLEAQLEKLKNFVLSKTECCDVCPETDTCINSEGTCPYAGILAKGEEEVTKKWLIRFIKRREK